METRQVTRLDPSRSQHGPGSSTTREPIRVNPKYPLPSALPPSEPLERSPFTDSENQDGVARRASRRRRASGTGSNEKAQLESFPQPPAPEVPRAPPVSYRDPYGNGHSTSSRNSNSTSFAARARALPGDTEFVPTSPPRNDFEPSDPTSADQITRHNRRGSINRSSGVDFSQSHPRAGEEVESPPTGPAPQQQLSSVATHRKNQYPDQSPPLQSVEQSNSKTYKDPKSAPSRSDTGRSSAGVAERRSDWATDRSPLQKLEVKLNDISKEEKRARVEEAEQQLRESLANSGRRRASVEVDPAVKRTSSKHVSTDTGVRGRKEPPGQHRGVQAGTISRDIAGGSEYFQTEHDYVGGRNGTRSENQLEPLQRDAYQQSRSQYTPTATKPTSSQDRTRRQTSGRTPNVWDPEHQPGRGVRFEGSGQVENQYHTPDTQLDRSTQRSYHSDHRGPGLQLDGATGSRGAQRSQHLGHREGQSAMGNQPSRQVPVEQQELYSQRTQQTHANDTAVTYGGIPDPVPGDAVPSRNQASAYEIPPQTAPGIKSKQKVGFGRSQGDAVEAPAHHKHHLSDILHHGQRNAVKQSHETNVKPGHLDEWRHGGTARLTATDFNTRSGPTTSQKAWWEGGRSGSRQASTGAKKDLGSGVQSTNGNSQNDYGMDHLSFSDLDLRSSEPLHSVQQASGEVHVRPYLGDEVLLRDHSDKHSWLQHYSPLLAHDSAINPNLGLSSAYSYSCPHLSEHDIYHIDHICKPYMSKELIKSMRSIRIRAAPKTDSFDPPLYLKCGPLLRYTGLKRDNQQSTSNPRATSSTEREFWRGSVMIVTSDAESTYNPAPTLRVYPEPMDILPPPPQRVDEDSGYDLPVEYIDPIAGLPKLSRTGKTIYVKPVEDLDQEVDLSRVEDDTGLYEETRTAAVPTSYGTPDFRPGRGNPSKPVNNNDRRGSSRTTSKGQQVRGVRLHTERGCTFWRFNLEIELTAHQDRIAYRINNSAAVGFWVPAKGQTMNVMFHSCNGFSMSVKYVVF